MDAKFKCVGSLIVYSEARLFLVYPQVDGLESPQASMAYLGDDGPCTQHLENYRFPDADLAPIRTVAVSKRSVFAC